jgi:hypothetical protein
MTLPSDLPLVSLSLSLRLSRHQALYIHNHSLSLCNTVESVVTYATVAHTSLLLYRGSHGA